MRRFVVGALAALLVAAPAGASFAQELKTDQDKTLYAMGLILGQKVASLNLTKAELAIIAQGLTDEATGAKRQVELEQWGPKVNEFARGRMAANTEQEKAKGKAFEEKSAKEPGAQKTASGLVYVEEKAGTGKSPAATDTVKVHYRGTLIDGHEFDSSYKRNAPAEFPLNGVIPCWTEGLQKMKAGGKAKLVCPSAIAYGDGGNQGIPGGATLVFEVELLEVKAPGAPPPPPPTPVPDPPAKKK